MSNCMVNQRRLPFLFFLLLFLVANQKQGLALGPKSAVAIKKGQYVSHVFWQNEGVGHFRRCKVNTEFVTDCKRYHDDFSDFKFSYDNYKKAVEREYKSNDVTSEIADWEKKAVDFKGRVDTKLEVIDELSERILFLQNKLKNDELGQSEIDHINDLIAHKKAQLNQVEEEVADLNADRDTIESELKKLKAKHKVQEEQKTELLFHLANQTTRYYSQKEVNRSPYLSTVLDLEFIIKSIEKKWWPKLKADSGFKGDTFWFGGRWHYFASYAVYKSGWGMDIDKLVHPRKIYMKFKHRRADGRYLRCVEDCERKLRAPLTIDVSFADQTKKKEVYKIPLVQVVGDFDNTYLVFDVSSSQRYWARWYLFIKRRAYYSRFGVYMQNWLKDSRRRDDRYLGQFEVFGTGEAFLYP